MTPAQIPSTADTPTPGAEPAMRPLTGDELRHVTAGSVGGIGGSGIVQPQDVGGIGGSGIH